MFCCKIAFTCYFLSVLNRSFDTLFNEKMLIPVSFLNKFETISEQSLLLFAFFRALKSYIKAAKPINLHIIIHLQHSSYYYGSILMI